MAFTPHGPPQPADSDGGVVAGVGAAIGKAFGSAEQKSAAIKGAESFKKAAAAGQFTVDPEAAKAAITELTRAEEHADVMKRHADAVARRPMIGGTPYAQQAAGWYEQGGLSAKKAVQADLKVLALYREAIEIAMRNYKRMDSDSSQSFGGKA